MVMRWVVKPLAITCVVAGLILTVWMWASLSYVYSSGERAGFIQKISKKGWLFKTWEGELAMVNLPGAMPEKFYFSVRSDDVARELEQALGQRVALEYNEHRYIPLPIFGETQHFVVNVRAVQDAVAPAPLPASAGTK